MDDVRCMAWWCNTCSCGVGLTISMLFQHQVTTLGKLFTYMCLCHQAVELGIGKRAVRVRLVAWESKLQVWQEVMAVDMSGS